MMNLDEVTAAIDCEYDRETGFLGQLRTGEFDEARAGRLVGLLEQLEVPDPVPLRLVQLVWMMPSFILWQVDRVESDARDDVVALSNKIESILIKKLGAP